MEARFLPKLRLKDRMALLQSALDKLRMDYGLNLKEKLFHEPFGRDLSFEEFLVMMLIEKDAELLSRRVFEVRPPTP